MPQRFRPMPFLARVAMVHGLTRRIKYMSVLLLWCVSLLITASPSVHAATFPNGFVEARIASQLSNPTALAIAPDGRVFVTLQGGQIRVIKNDALLPTPFASVNVDWKEERGLLGIALDPDFGANQYVYVYYTTTIPTEHNRITRFKAHGDTAAPGSEMTIFELSPLYPKLNTHNGGALHFGADGKLYVAVGDNNYPKNNAQLMTNHFGKILRINRDGTIPADNPFYGTASGSNRAIWALGLRNPFTFAIQPGTGRLFINDVGGDLWEEINEGVAGSNYGWPNEEGPSTNHLFRGPIYAYKHGSGSELGCAITGGTFYNPSTAQFPNNYTGKYFFADYCNGWIKHFDPASKAVVLFASRITTPIGLEVGPDGSLYYLSAGLDRQGNGAVYKVQYRTNAPPMIMEQPSNITVKAGESATFSVSATGSPPLRYQWQRNGVNISGATGATYTIASTTTGDHGAQFRCVVSNTSGTVTSTAATLSVTTTQRPVATITSPPGDSLYQAGETVSFAGVGTDAEDGELPPRAFTWRVDFHHNDHIHPFMAETSGTRSGSFTTPTMGETSPNVWYRIHLMVRDTNGLPFATFRDLRPRTSTVTVTTKPAGLQVKIDEQLVSTPFSTRGVVGTTRTMSVVSPQKLEDQLYYFVSWSDGGSSAHAITMPATNTTYTAQFGLRMFLPLTWR